MTLDVHAIVEDAYDFDHGSWSNSVHQEVPSTMTVSRDMQRAKTRPDLSLILDPTTSGPSPRSPIA
jgi:hypothetical protein